VGVEPRAAALRRRYGGGWKAFHACRARVPKVGLGSTADMVGQTGRRSLVLWAASAAQPGVVWVSCPARVGRRTAD
jgi:hypothetical protein